MKNYKLLIAAFFIGTILSLSSCLKNTFDAPPDMSGYDPNLPVNMRIDSLKILMATSGEAKRIDSNWTIYGIVTADDRSGNFYKQIVIEDSTGAIHLLIDGNSLYNKYPVGRKVYVKLQGLYFGYYAKLPQIGATPDFSGSMSNISPAKADSAIVKANIGNALPDNHFSDLSMLSTVNYSMINRLVTIDSIQISAGDTSKTYAQSPTISSGTSITVEDCSKNKLIIRSSGYANFQSYKLPKGKGTLTAIYTVYNNTPQLVIRDTSDLKFYSERCGANIPIITIDSLRKMYPGSGTITLPTTMFAGTVISDVDNGNAGTSNFILQDGSGKGIMLYLSGGNYKLGDSLVLDASGASLLLYKGALEITGITTSSIIKVASGKTVVPKLLTIAEINNNFYDYESTLVVVENAEITAGGTFSGNKTMTDGSTGNIILYTASTASFAGTNVWAGQATVTSIVTPFNTTKELKMRNINDVQ